MVFELPWVLDAIDAGFSFMGNANGIEVPQAAS